MGRGGGGVAYGVLAAVVRPSQSVMANASRALRGRRCCGKITREFIHREGRILQPSPPPLVNFAALSCQIFAVDDGIFIS